MKTFKPILAPNESVDLSEVKYPVLASFKLDGIRCIFYKGQILSRSLKQIPNKQLREKFEPLRKYSEDNNCILDGEIYSPHLTFQEITHYVMTQDLYQPKVGTSKGTEILPDHLNFYCFDCIIDENPNESYDNRVENYLSIAEDLHPIDCLIVCSQAILKSKKDVENYFDTALGQGYEGLILRNPSGRYKYGRGTIKEGIIYKVKPFETFDAQITEVLQGTKVNPNAEKKINELGRSVTSKKKDDRILVDRAYAFVVKYNNLDLKVNIDGTDEEETDIWKNKESYIGRWIEYKGMLIGSKDLPRHAGMIRFREDKDK